MIALEDRQMAVELIDQTMSSGARQRKACEVVGISPRTYQRWQTKGFEDRRQCVTKQPANKLTEQERQAIIDICNQEAYCSLTPKQIVPKLADRHIYLASESTFYRYCGQKTCCTTEAALKRRQVQNRAAMQPLGRIRFGHGTLRI